MKSKLKLCPFRHELPRNADAFKARDDRWEGEPVDRRPFLLQLLDAVCVGGNRKRHLAGDDEVRQQGMTFAHRYAVGRDDIAEKLEALVLA